MRDLQVLLRNVFIAEQQDVDVDRSRTPVSCAHAPALALDGLRRPQQLVRCAVPLDLEHLVQEARLVQDAPWLGLNDRAVPQDARALLTQAPARGAEIASATAEV